MRNNEDRYALFYTVLVVALFYVITSGLVEEVIR